MHAVHGQPADLDILSNQQRSITLAVYFARLSGEGLFKVGASATPAVRLSALRQKHPSILMLGTMPGYRGREAAMHMLLRDYDAGNEFFREEGVAYQIICHAIETGLDWFPAEREVGPEWTVANDFRGRVVRAFGSETAFSEMLGIKIQSYRMMMNWAPSHRMWAALCLQEAKLNGTAPRWLCGPRLSLAA